MTASRLFELIIALLYLAGSISYPLGLVLRRADPGDKRRLTVEITEAGRELVGGIYAPAVQAMEQGLAPLTMAERTTLMALLSRLT